MPKNGHCTTREEPTIPSGRFRKLPISDVFL